MKKYNVYYAIVVPVVLATLALFPKWTVDDAYIYFRYSKNLAKHGEFTFVLIHRTSNVEMNIQAGLYLKHRVPDSEWLVVHKDAGAISYYSGLRTVDFGAINDEYLAHNKNASLKERVNYFFLKNPGAVVFTTYEWNRVSHGTEAMAIISDPRFNYKLVRKFGNSLGLQYYEIVFLRGDLLKKGEEMSLF